VDKIIIPDRAAAKANMTVTTEAAATLSIATSEVILAIGTNVRDAIQLRGINAIGSIADALREAGYPQLGAPSITWGVSTPPGNVTIGSDTLLNNLPAFTEDQVVIAYDSGFYPPFNSHVYDTIIRKALELYMEDVAKIN
jgi:hypothetical protein